MSDDAELVERVAAGDRQAFLHLYDRYVPRVLGLAQRMLGERMAAEEVTQDAFVKLWTRAVTFNPARGTLLSWLLTVTRRTALDRLRLEGRRPQVVEPPDEEQGWDELPDGASGGDEARWRSLRFAVADLPREQRLVIELAFYHGLSHSQIAEHARIPLGTVKTRLRLGMEKLRQSWLLEEELSKRETNPPRRGVLRGQEDAI
jgi:RNA polymerase sigma-70 factor (ECF subfamily)